MEEQNMKLTPHFSLAEMTRTSVKGVDNTPTVGVVSNLIRVCRWLEMLREEYNRRYGEPAPASPLTPLPEARGTLRGEGEEPIIINSGYRSPAVNRAVGGAQNSNHLTGCAADIRALGIEQALRYAVILLDISDESQESFDELLIEHKGNDYWIHFAVRPKGNRRRTLFM